MWLWQSLFLVLTVCCGKWFSNAALKMICLSQWQTVFSKLFLKSMFGMSESLAWGVSPDLGVGLLWTIAMAASGYCLFLSVLFSRPEFHIKHYKYSYDVAWAQWFPNLPPHRLLENFWWFWQITSWFFWFLCFRKKTKHNTTLHECWYEQQQEVYRSGYILNLVYCWTFWGGTNHLECGSIKNTNNPACTLKNPSGYTQKLKLDGRDNSKK